MDSKKCTCCNKILQLSYFGVLSRSKDGLREICKACGVEKGVKFRQSKKGVISALFHRQIRNSRKRKHNPPEYTISDLYDYLLNNVLFDFIYNKWVDSGYDTNKNLQLID